MAKLQKIFVGPGVLEYPKVSRPDTYGKYADNKFKTGTVVSAADSASARQTILAFAKEHGVKEPYVYEGQDRTIPFYENEEGEFVFSAKTQDKPLIVDSKNKKLPENVLVGGGTKANIQVAINGWTKKTKVKGKPVEVKGVNLFLNAVQVLDLVRYSSREDSPFDEADGYVGGDDASDEAPFEADEADADEGDGDPDEARSF